MLFLSVLLLLWNQLTAVVDSCASHLANRT